MKSKTKRKNVKRVDSLLAKNAALNASLGMDSTKTEIEVVRKDIRANIKKIKDMCEYTYNIINVDDNHKTVH
ncbi:MAG: hypothetical protein CMI60_00875 [Parvibaculum sp.]|nr:hypothetical protein [Parvibaculum sp.]